MVVGIDEVGRGAWAGPVVAAAVVLPFGLQIDRLADSKLITEAVRVQLDRTIRAQAIAVGIGWVASQEVDEHGLSWAVRQSGLRSLEAIEIEFEVILLDGSHNYLADDIRATVTVKGDALITPIAAASVVAKVARDRYMIALAGAYPAYGFEAHKGYGTALHQRALQASGVSSQHRRSYRPLQGLPACQ
jgi:ribonuclease HII